jgi:hypothetical protein
VVNVVKPTAHITKATTTKTDSNTQTNLSVLKKSSAHKRVDGGGSRTGSTSDLDRSSPARSDIAVECVGERASPKMSHHHDRSSPKSDRVSPRASPSSKIVSEVGGGGEEGSGYSSNKSSPSAHHRGLEKSADPGDYSLASQVKAISSPTTNSPRSVYFVFFLHQLPCLH